jgi:hypothetical protein
MATAQACLFLEKGVYIGAAYAVGAAYFGGWDVPLAYRRVNCDLGNP